MIFFLQKKKINKQFSIKKVFFNNYLVYFRFSVKTIQIAQSTSRNNSGHLNKDEAYIGQLYLIMNWTPPLF